MNELFQNSRFVKALCLLVMVVALFYAGQFVNGVKTYSTIGRDLQAPATINVSGTGEAFKAPDIANITFSVTKDAKTVAEAQKLSADKINEIMSYLKEQKIADKDIKTTNYSLNPKYEYPSVICPMGSYCPQGRQVLVGYTVSQSITIKIRTIDTAGTILAGLGDKGATDIGGIELAVDQKDAVQDEARDKAIQDAKDKAAVLAKSLGVKLVRITSYSESGNYPQPMYYAQADMGMMKAAGSVAPSIPTGENKFTSNVTLTYEIQ